MYYHRWEKGRIVRKEFRIQPDTAYAIGFGFTCTLLGGLLVLFLMSGCGYAPPRTITVSPDLPEGIQVAAARARDAWCAVEVHWCPELVDRGGEDWIDVGTFHESCTPELSECAFAINWHEGGVTVSPEAAEFSADDLTGILTHEFGHYGISGHANISALMHAVFPDGVQTIPWRVDTQAAVEWCRQQGC